MFAARTAPAPRVAVPTPVVDYQDDDPDLPDPSDAEVLPVEIGLRYTYPEPFGIAEVSHVLPAGRIYRLADGREIVNDDLEPGMQVVLKDGAVGTLSSVKHFYEPPDPPLQVGPGLFLARVVGTIKHKGIETIDVSWPGNTVTGSTDHKFYSVSRGGYVPASELQVGEILQTDDGRHVPVTSVGERKLGLIDLYNVEVEHFHNYHVGTKPSVLVHNGAAGAGGYINTPADLGKAVRRGKYEPSKFDDMGRVIPVGKSTKLDLDGASVGFTKATYGKSEGFTYVLRDKSTGEILKVGKTTGGVNIYERFNKYRRKGLEYGYKVEVEFWQVGKNADAKALERQMRAGLKSTGERLPWDKVANPGRNDLGLPWERTGGTVFGIE
ncbi:MAG: HINT domain-containing protein [Gemmataceae bacterium]|nr:HINT domain-containing protein [Gemmataceae bacterium]